MTPAFMIDGAGTVDRDDAIRLLPGEDGTRILEVLVADITGAIAADPGLVGLALERGASQYRRQVAVAPMLPRGVEEACTLAEGVERPALSVRIALGPDGTVGDAVLSRCTLSDAVALTHEQAAAAVKDRRDPHHAALTDLRTIAEALFRARYGSACAFYDLGRGVFVDEDGALVKVRPSRVVGHLIVQECMIAANRAVAAWAARHDVPIMYRNHAAAIAAPPPAVHLEDLSAALRSEDPTALASWMERAELTGHRARYDAHPRGHHGLAVPVYCHATSPLRRAADLVTQHAVMAALDGAPAPYTAEEIAGHCERLTVVIAEAKAAGSAAARERAHQAARRILDADTAYQRMTADAFHALVKRATKEGISSPGFLAEAARRADADVLELRDLYHLLLLPAGPRWAGAKTACLAQVARKPERAVSLVAMHALTRSLPAPQYTVSEAGVGHEPVFTVAGCAVTVDGGSVAGAPRRAGSKKAAQGQAAISLLALLAGVPDISRDLADEAAPTPAVPKADAVLDPFAALNHARNTGVLADLKPSFEQHVDPDGKLVFSARLAGRHASGVVIVGQGQGSTKKAAKAVAAVELVERLTAAQESAVAR